jgi:hypothetical protein
LTTSLPSHTIATTGPDDRKSTSYGSKQQPREPVSAGGSAWVRCHSRSQLERILACSPERILACSACQLQRPILHAQRNQPPSVHNTHLREEGLPVVLSVVLGRQRLHTHSRMKRDTTQVRVCAAVESCKRSHATAPPTQAHSQWWLHCLTGACTADLQSTPGPQSASLTGVGTSTLMPTSL